MSGHTADDVAQWLPAARAGSSEALGQALEACRRYLLLIANERLDPSLQAKGGASDIVQETFLEAQRDFGQFQGDTAEDLRLWLRRFLINNVTDFARHYGSAEKRRADREVPLRGGATDSQSGVQIDLPAATPTPSGEAMAAEQAKELQQVIDRLPDDYRRVITLRNREDRPFDEIARLMDRSENAVRKLWFRAIEQLQRDLDTSK